MAKSSWLWITNYIPQCSVGYNHINGLAQDCGNKTANMLKLLQTYINSLAPGRPGCHFKTAIFNLVLLIGIFTSSKDNALRWMPWDLAGDKSTLVQVMTWCRQATSHYLSQCWPSSMSPYGVTRPQRVKPFIFSYPKYLLIETDPKRIPLISYLNLT